MNFEIFVLGTGGMMPLPGRHLTSVLARREGELFLFDCGEGTQVSLKKLNLKWKKISSIFISHMHADHVTGLPGMLMLSSQVERNEPLTIYGPGKIKSYIDENRRILDMYINYEIDVQVISQSGVIVENDQYKITAFKLDHTKECYGYSLEEKNRPGIFHPGEAIKLQIPCGPLWSELQKGNNIVLQNGKIIKPLDVMGKARSGRKFTFITDTTYNNSIAKYASNSDLLICEGMFEEALKDSAAEKKHLTAKQAAIIASEAGKVKKMGLIHYSPRYSNRELGILEKEAKEIFPNTVLCHDRQQFELAFNDEEIE